MHNPLAVTSYRAFSRARHGRSEYTQPERRWTPVLVFRNRNGAATARRSTGSSASKTGLDLGSARAARRVFRKQGERGKATAAIMVQLAPSVRHAAHVSWRQ